jgi:tetratricopeptide (TPR) repeat protein
MSQKNNSSAEKKVAPYPRPHKSLCKAQDAYTKLAASIQEQLSASKDSTGAIVRTINIDALRRCSFKKLDDLKPILLTEMHVNKVHTGTFLLCRTVAEAVCGTSVITVVQDETDEAELLNLHGFLHNFDIEPSVVLPKHSVLLIKEPHLRQVESASSAAPQQPVSYAAKVSSQKSDAQFEIRVESPSDVVVLTDFYQHESYTNYLPYRWFADSDDPAKPATTFEQLNRLGNKYFVDHDYYQAIRYYTKALNVTLQVSGVKASEMKKTLANRAAANLRLEKFCQAYQDGLKSTEIEIYDAKVDSVSNLKAFFRMGKAAYGMRQYEMALDAFRKCFELDPKNRDALAEVEETKKRIKETKSGKYDMKALIEQARVKHQTRLNVADFVSELVEVTSLNNDPNYKGKWLFNLK